MTSQPGSKVAESTALDYMLSLQPSERIIHRSRLRRLVVAEPQRLSWVNNPDTRGTLEIFWSCFVTLSLCVWTAVHPNIQWRAPKEQMALVARLSMMATAIVFPEILISAAWRQREQTVSLKEKLAGHSGSLFVRARGDGLAPPASSHFSEHASGSVRSGTPVADSAEAESRSKAIAREWTEKELFFAVMGGFVVEQTFIDSHGKSRKLRYIVNPEGIELLVLAGVSLNLDPDEIDERDNADYIAKLIVIAQVSWFAIQIVARLSQGIPVTALEIHTVIHVGCAILMYVIWWYKPYNLTRPVVLADSTSETMAALMICNEVVKRLRETELQDHEQVLKAYWHRLAVQGSDHSAGSEHVEPLEPRDFHLKNVLRDFLDPKTTPDLPSNTADEVRILSSLAEKAQRGVEMLEPKLPLIASAIESISGIRQKSNNFTVREVWGAWSSDTGHEMSTAKLLHFGFNLLYGGAHAAAWSSHTFPTQIEQALWRSSATFIASVWLWGMIWVLFWGATRSASRWCLPFRNGDLEIIFGPFFCGVVVAFVLARCYLFVESIASLRSLPARAYDNIAWTDFIPHSS